MAKRRKKKSSIATSLKYEVYGILLITISVIAFSGEATVGRSLSKLFGLLLGKFYFVLALVGIYVGLAVMVKRVWPKGWSNKKTGILLLVLALTLNSSIKEIQQKFNQNPAIEQTSGAIFNQLTSDIRSSLLTSDANRAQAGMTQQDISGGYVGAIQYTILFSLFGYYGAYLMMIVMFAISLMLMTGKSYVELIRMVRKRGTRLIRLMAAKWSQRPRPAAVPVPPSGPGSRGRKPEQAVIDSDDNDLDDDYDGYAVSPARKKRSLFFSWLTPGQETSEKGRPAHQQDEWLMDEEEAGRASGIQAARPHWSKDWEEDWDESQPPDDLIYQESHQRSAAHPAWEEDASNPGMTSDNLRDVYENIEQAAPWSEPWQAEAQPHATSLPHKDRLSGGDDDDDAEASLAVPSQSGSSHTLGQEVPLAADDAVDGAVNSESPAIVTSEVSSEGSAATAIGTEHPKEKPYLLPPFSLLTKPSLIGRTSEGADSMDSRRKLEATLESFGVRAKVLDVVRGPAVTRYEVQPATGVKVSRIVSLTDDIALALAAKDIRMEAPIPGKSAIGIEVPNMEVSVVTMREVMETAPFQNAPSKLSIAFGRDISGMPIIGNLARMPHLLVAGATGSGKSVCINGIITSILYKAAPDEVKFLMIDPKMVELNVYNGIPHLLAPVVTDPRRASLALKKIVVEMEKRYELFSKSATRNIEGYNALVAENPAAVLPYIVVIVDELADLMMVAANDVEDSIARLAQMARAAGIHLIIATQRPSVDVITGVIKANIPSRIAFGVSSQVDSRTILDMAGAEKLLGRGDMLFLPVGMSKPIRVQGAFLSDQEVETLVSYARDQAEAEYKEDLVPEIDDEQGSDGEIVDELYDQAVQIVVDAKQASVSLLQRRMRIGYTRAARLIDQMEARGIVGPYEGSKPREVLMTIDQLQASRIPS
ncbi:DNA translocase FtsK 4TM domain-containing protein [Paenibacillus sp. GCM10023252]|uniref:FtsK/SpoIIIE family DNA translocase n=1 Tax=Paenibacillus sp. GCM10023252 TaxID=3252649 RepID=UPI00361E02D1